MSDLADEIMMQAWDHLDVPDIVDRFSEVAVQFLGSTSVREYVRDVTPYIPKHLTAALRAAEDSGALKVEPKKTDGSKRTGGTYPDLAQMEFK